MNKIKRLTVAGSIVMASSLLAPSVVNADIFVSGTSCESANLNQALQGIGWSQGGVKNNSMASFFVVCPMDIDTTQTPPSAALAGASFSGSGAVVECTARVQDLTTGGFTSAAFTVSAGENTGNPNTGWSGAALSFTGIVNATVVCALDPGEGISWVFGD